VTGTGSSARNASLAHLREASPRAADWARLLSTLRRGRMGRIVVRSVLECSGTRVGELEGEFAVIPA